MTRRFEARDVPSYGEPVEADALAVGETYFAVQFIDDEMHIPHVYPLVYLGCGFVIDHPDEFVFQDAGSYRQGMRYDAEDDQRADFYLQSGNELSHIYTFEKAVERVLWCSMNRVEKS